MTSLEHVESLRKRANISYEEAKRVLDECDGDLLEALMRLEAEGKVVPPGGGAFSSDGTPQGNYGGTQPQVIVVPQGKYQKEKKEKVEYDDSDGTTFGQFLGKVGRLFAKLVHKGNRNYLEVRRHSETMIQVPLTVFVLLLIFLFWITIPLMIVGLFFGCRYVFTGKEVESTSVNKAMGKASEAVDNLKKEFKEDSKEDAQKDEN